MASQVNPNTIDITYPVAGQDNNSQGFRDNFTNIRTNLLQVKAELEDLQSKVVLKSALTGASLDNNMNGDDLTGNAAPLYDLSVTGNLYINGGITNRSYTYEARSNGGTLAANTTFNTFYIDNVSSGVTLSSLDITVPDSAENGKILIISTICPVTTVTWDTPSGYSTRIKGVTSTDFATAGSTVKLQWLQSQTFWAKTQ